MATVSIVKIQLRRGVSADLPGAPVTLSPLVFETGLDQGELGFTTDSGRLFIGIGTGTATFGMPNYHRTTFPYQNIEVLTENSPVTSAIFGGAFSDNQDAYIQSVPMQESTSFKNLQVISSSSGVAQDFYVDIAGVGASAMVTYFIFDSDDNPIRQGKLTILWNTDFVGEPLCSDEAQAQTTVYNDIRWQAGLIGSVGSQHVVLQYTNATGDTPTVYFRVDRLHP